MTYTFTTPTGVPAPRAAGAPASDGGFLLSHTIATDPEPLTVGPSGGDPVPAALEVMLTNDTGAAIGCQSVVIELPLGPKAGDIAANLTGARVTPTLPGPDWKLESTIEADAATFTIRNGASTPVLKENETLHLRIADMPMNTAEGVTEVAVTEKVKETSGAAAFSEHTATYRVGKFPDGFRVWGLRPDKAVLRPGERTVLRWSAEHGPGSPVSLTLTRNGAEEVDVANLRAWPTRRLHNDTFFRITASFQQDGRTVEHHLDTDVHVLGGDATVGSLDVTSAVRSMSLPSPFTIGPAENPDNQPVFYVQNDGFLWCGLLLLDEGQAWARLQNDSGFNPDRLHLCQLAPERQGTYSRSTYFLEPGTEDTLKHPSLLLPVPGNSLVSMSTSAEFMQAPRPPIRLDGYWVGQGPNPPRQVAWENTLQVFADPFTPTTVHITTGDMELPVDGNAPRVPAARWDLKDARERWHWTAEDDWPARRVSAALPVPENRDTALLVGMDGRFTAYSAAAGGVDPENETDDLDAFFGGRLPAGIMNGRALTGGMSVPGHPERAYVVVGPDGVWLDRPLPGVAPSWLIEMRVSMKGNSLVSAAPVTDVCPGVPRAFAGDLRAMIPVSAFDPENRDPDLVLFITQRLCLRYDMRAKAPVGSVQYIYAEFPQLLKG